MTSKPVTLQDLKASTVQLVLHMKLAKGGAYFEHRCIEFPALRRVSQRATSRDQWSTDWYVADRKCASLSEATAALNETTEAPVMADTSEAPTEISIADQIEEVEKEIRQRERIYPEWVKAGKYKGETANRKLAVMRRAAASSRWLQENRDWIHETHAQRREAAHWERCDAASHPDVARVLEEFPGAEVVGERPMTRQMEAAE